MFISIGKTTLSKTTGEEAAQRTFTTHKPNLVAVLQRQAQTVLDI